MSHLSISTTMSSWSGLAALEALQRVPSEDPRLDEALARTARALGMVRVSLDLRADRVHHIHGSGVGATLSLVAAPTRVRFETEAVVRIGAHVGPA